MATYKFEVDKEVIVCGFKGKIINRESHKGAEPTYIVRVEHEPDLDGKVAVTEDAYAESMLSDPASLE